MVRKNKKCSQKKNKRCQKTRDVSETGPRKEEYDR
jgi:hypothetical protein